MQIFFLCVFFLLGFALTGLAQAKNEDELKKQASALFEAEDYNTAYKLYSQLVSLYPKDPEYNYRLGVCMLFTEPDKKKPFSYFQTALKNPAEAPKDAKFYLARTYHVNYKFDEAIKLYTEYRQTASAASIKKLQVDREIEACRNGKKLLSNLSDLVIISKKQLNEADYFRSYDIRDIGGKLLVKPEDFKTGSDKKKKDNSVVYLPRSGERVYYSSYGENGSNGRDIYFVNRLPNGSWSKPQPMPAPINTEYDEDYPFLHPNGRTLYFSSKGHNSMGGYDIFKTTYNPETQSWSKPENLEFPINSPDDDILFVTDSLEKTAFFSTGRYSPYGKIDVLKINTERRPMNFAILKGTVVKEEVSQSLLSKITVKNMENGEIVGTYQAKENGDYYMELPNGGKFIFTVETPGLPTQSDGVQVPIAYSLKPYKQVISYDKKVLKIINYFDGQVADENYSMMIDLIEKKAKLEVNINDPYDSKLKTSAPGNASNSNAGNVNNASNGNNLNAVSTTNPAVQPGNNAGNKSGNNTASKSVTNEQLLAIAKTDAIEAENESKTLRQEAQEAFDLSTQKSAEAASLQKQADEAAARLNSISDASKKNEETVKVNQLKEDSKTAAAIASTAGELAKKLEMDANQKKQEADLTNQYIAELEAVTKNKNNKQALAKLEEIQKQLDALSNQKNQSDELVASIKAEQELKQNELKKTESKNKEVLNEINLLKGESQGLENDLANETDKSLKENISAQIRELNNDIEEKNKELSSNNQKIASLQSQVEGLNKELEAASKIMNDSGSAGTSMTSATNNTTDDPGNATEAVNETNAATDNNSLSYEKISQKYDAQLIEKPDPKNKEALGTQNDVLRNYNKEIGEVMALNKSQLSKTRSDAEKKKLNAELKKLEQQKNKNDQQITANTSALKQLESQAIAANNTDNTAEKTGTVTDNSDNKSKEPGNTSAITNAGDNTPSALSNTITTPGGDADAQAQTLVTEAEDLNNKAYEQRKASAGKSGAERDNLIRQAQDNEALAVKKKLQASDIQKKSNQSKFDNNSGTLSELQKLTGNKTSNEISQANLLADEASTNFSQAQKIRNEADAYPSGAAKLGGLSNAEEKENEALLKQQKAIELLAKANPAYKPKNNAGTNEPGNVSATNPADEAGKTRIATYTALSQNNQNSWKQQNEALSGNPALKSAKNKQAQELQKASENLNKEALALISQANKSTDASTKESLLKKANEKESEALKKIEEASALVQQTGNDIASENVTANSAETNTGNTTTEPVTAATANNQGNDTNTSKNPEGNKRSNTSGNNGNTQVNTTGNETPVATSTTQAAGNKPGNTGGTEPAGKTNTAAASSTTAPTGTNPASEANRLASGLNDPAESKLTGFNNYTNTEAITLKDQAAEKINKALDEDKNIAATLGQVKQLAFSASSQDLSQETITASIAEAEQMNDQAYELRKSSAAKTGAEKEQELGQARTLETKAISKKIEAAEKQKQLNAATFEANSQSLAELATMAKGKNISELSTAEMQLNEASLYFAQAQKLREETNAYPSDAAKLGGLSNAEEKETWALSKQKALLATYQKYFSNYTPKPVNAGSQSPEAAARLNEAKSSLSSNNQLHVEGLQLLSESVNKEYTSRLSALPALKGNDQTLKAKAQDLYKKYQATTAQALQSNDPARKKELLIKANSEGQEAISLLSQITTPGGAIASGATGNNTNNSGNNSGNAESSAGNTNAIARNNTANNSGNSNNNSNNNRNNSSSSNTTNAVNNAAAGNRNNTGSNGNNRNNTNNAAAASHTATLKIDGLEVKPGNAYTESNPIPLDTRIPDGLVFKVQIGAFKNLLPDNTFKGLSPLIAQTTPSGYIRYMAGNFEKYENANAVKNDLRNLGYGDAFVVAYFNGKRIDLNEAMGKAKEAGQSIDLVNAGNSSAGITANVNVPRNTAPAVASTNAPADSQSPEITNELEKMNGLLYTVQIGVYSKQVTRAQLSNLRPIYTEKLPSGLYRYTAGIYNQGGKLLEDKRKVVELGVKDAFVSAYYNAKRIPFAEGQKLQTENKNLKMEAENPIIFPGTSSLPSANPPANADNSTPPAATNPSTVAAFSNGVNQGPAPTADNGVKTDETGISYKVQIGAYRNQVPDDVASKFMNIKTWPVTHQVINNLYVYTIGNFTAPAFAKKLRDEAVSLGIGDAFITVYRDGKKLYGAEATGYLNK